MKVFVVYEREPDAERYARHVEEYVRKVPGEFQASGRDGAEMGVPFTVHFGEVR